MMVQKRFEFVGSCDSDLAEDSAKRQSIEELCNTVSVRLEMDSDSARHNLQRRGPGELKHIVIRCLALQRWTRGKRPSVGRVDTKDNRADLHTKHLDGPKRRFLSRKLALHVTRDTDD